MSITLQGLGIDRLSFDDRLSLVQELWDSIAIDVENQALTEDQRAEVDRRLTAYQADPRSAVPWEQVKAEIESRLKP